MRIGFSRFYPSIWAGQGTVLCPLYYLHHILSFLCFFLFENITFFTKTENRPLSCGLGFHSVALCGEFFVLFFLSAEAVGEVIVTAAVFVLGDRGGGILHYRLPYHFGEEIHLPLAIRDVIVNKIRVRQRFLHVS